jgi:hypothetical protein
MALGRQPVTDFLNVDLDLRAERGLDELLGALEPFVIVLNNTTHEASVELNGTFSSLEETLVNLISLVNAHPPQARTIWNQCDFRRMNIGIQAGHEPHQTYFAISSKVVSLLASVQAEITLTVYAPPD